MKVFKILHQSGLNGPFREKLTTLVVLLVLIILLVLIVLLALIVLLNLIFRPLV